jgi:hypothetical protein
MACILDPANDVIYNIYIYGYIERYCLKHQIMSDPMLRRVVFSVAHGQAAQGA